MTPLRKMYNREMLVMNKNLQNLRETDAGKKAIELDKADGKQDEKISANIWNEFVKDYGGNEIRNEINVIDAMNSITTYMVREETEALNADIAKIKEETLQRWQSLNNNEVEGQEPLFGL
ncbi:hypothetical protein IJ384_02435 [bacterium]|nr:hypothetical protein [bacterium]